ncbi:MAG TPA: TMEM175 family protein [Bacteroidia bacterium]|nr:TMEM175 family protein [Bacteroidia bacterium]
MQTPNYNYDKKRFETFIDAVIAIILTILVLELRVPETGHSESINTREQLVALLPSFMSYLGSFLLIVGIWIDHHLLFLNLDKLNKRYILLNMLFILLLSVVPFTTAFAGHHHSDSFAVALLFVNYVLMNVSFGCLYWYANMKGFLPPSFFSDNKATARYSMVGIAGLIAAIPLAYANTYVSFALGILIFGGHLFKKK